MTYEQILEQIAERDERLVVMTAENRAAIRNLPPRIGKRFIDVGICEQTMIGAAAGLALRGRTPVTHALATFITLRAFEFVRTDVGISGLPVKLVGGVPGFLSEANGPTHQAVEDVSLMRGIPNMNVFCPADAEELALGIEQVIDSPSPFYIRHIGLPPAVQHSGKFEIGKAEVFGNGSDVAILTYGFMLREAADARQRLEDTGLSVRLLNLRTLKPIDEAAILDAVRECRLVVTVEDHFITGGLFSILSELLAREGMSADILPIALQDRWFRPALLDDVLEYEGFTGEKIVERIVERMGS